MVDTHAHAPQFVNAGNGLDMPLLEWLETYTFPAETRFKDADYAKKSTCVCGDVCMRACVCVCVCVFCAFCKLESLDVCMRAC
jgi:cytosine/adenosine deaminase-related metal-dependent hydrolase